MARTRDYRRFKQFTHFKRRVRDFYNTGWYGKNSFADFKKEVESGRKHRWLRTTACPCNCEMCSSYNKYKRLQKCKVLKLIRENLWT